MRKKRFLFYAGVLSALIVLATGLVASADPVPRMSVDELKQRLGQDSLIVLDVRTKGNWDDSDVKVATAVRLEAADLEQWVTVNPRDKTYVLYCA